MRNRLARLARELMNPTTRHNNQVLIHASERGNIKAAACSASGRYASSSAATKLDGLYPHAIMQQKQSNIVLCVSSERYIEACWNPSVYRDETCYVNQRHDDDDDGLPDFVLTRSDHSDGSVTWDVRQRYDAGDRRPPSLLERPMLVFEPLGDGPDDDGRYYVARDVHGLALRVTETSVEIIKSVTAAAASSETLEVAPEPPTEPASGEPEPAASSETLAVVAPEPPTEPASGAPKPFIPCIAKAVKRPLMRERPVWRP